MRCILIDAFKPEYLKYTSYLKSLAKENLTGELEVTLGYTSIMASFMTGCYPDKHHVIDIFDIRNKPKIQLNNFFLVNLKNLLKNNRNFYAPLKIPMRFAKYFRAKLDKAWPQKDCLKLPTIFDVLEKNNKSFVSIDYPNYFRDRKAKLFFSNSAEKIVKLTLKSKADFVYSHFIELDTIAHQNGTESRKTISTIRYIDEMVEKLDCKDMLIFSDHGMNNIKRSIDLESKLNELNFKFGRDYIYFLGSTMVRFWFKNKHAENEVKELLKTLKFGKIVDLSEFKLSKTCDLIFMANLGTVIRPNFFLENNYKAMHGWNPKQQKAFYLIKGLKGNRNAKIVDLFPTIASLMKIPKLRCDGISLA